MASSAAYVTIMSCNGSGYSCTLVTRQLYNYAATFNANHLLDTDLLFLVLYLSTCSQLDHLNLLVNHSPVLDVHAQPAAVPWVLRPPCLDLLEEVSATIEIPCGLPSNCWFRLESLRCEHYAFPILLFFRAVAEARWELRGWGQKDHSVCLWQVHLWGYFEFRSCCRFLRFSRSAMFKLVYRYKSQYCRHVHLNCLE